MLVVDEISTKLHLPFFEGKSRLIFQLFFRPVALRKAKIVYKVGLSECSRIKLVQE